MYSLPVSDRQRNPIYVFTIRKKAYYLCEYLDETPLNQF